MARPLASAETRDDTTTTAAQRRRRIDRSTARALAAALSALAVSAVVVGTSSSALVRHGTGVSSDITTGVITLADDDDGRSLVELRSMAPGRPVTQCLEVSYTGSVVPVDLTLRADSDGDIGPWVTVDVARGRDGGFDDCAGFVHEHDVFTGTLAELTEDTLAVGSFSNLGESMTFRVRFDLADHEDAAGRVGTIDFVWEAAPR